MPRLRLALAQVDPTVGDINGNAAIVRAFTRTAADAGAHLVAFPEMMLTGYPVEDLVFRDSFVTASTTTVPRLAKELAAEGLGEIAVIVGYLDADGPTRPGSDSPSDRGARNALAVLHRGTVAARYFKHHLPNYGVFDEDRYFRPGQTLTVLRLGSDGDQVDVAMAICEDMWQAGGPFAAARVAGASLVVTINGSPYELDKDDVRLPLVASRAAEAGATVAYVNMVGGQDELVFDGDSMIVSADGTLIARAPQFAEHLLCCDLDLPPAGNASPQVTASQVTAADEPPAAADGMAIERVVIDAPLRPTAVPLEPPSISPRLRTEEEVWQALVLGLRDYVRKNGFRKVILGLSGGIDSSIVAAIAIDAIGAGNVTGVSMPSGYSSQHSRDDAEDLAKRTGLDYRTVPIQPMVDAFHAAMQRAGGQLTGLAAENLQARVRGLTLMSISNEEGHLVLTTGNKSELAVGYSTLYGDSVGGFNPIKDVLKTMVWQLSWWRNAEADRRGEVQPIPENAITKPPSAELRPDQLDSDSLPEYDQLDAVLAGYVDGDLGRAELLAAGHDPALVDRVLRLVDIAEYKRRQSAPGPKITGKAFGRDRRLPITNGFRESMAHSSTANNA